MLVLLCFPAEPRHVDGFLYDGDLAYSDTSDGG